MIKYEKLSGVDIPVSTIGKLSVTPEGVAIGGIPGWKMLVDPKYKVSQNSGLRNRALPSNYVSSASALISEEFQNLELAFRSDAATMAAAPRGGFDINPSEWSIAGVVQAGAGARTASTSVVRSLINSADPDVGINLLISASGNIALDSKTPVSPFIYRITTENAPVTSGKGAAFYLLTFSTDLGLNLFVNGAPVASNSGDKRPLTPAFASSNNFCMFSDSVNNVGKIKFGMHCIFDVDLSKPENAGHRVLLTKFMMNKYSLSS